MYIQQFSTSCPGETSYYIEQSGEAAIIDPLKDIETYVKFAAERKATIKYIFETQYNAAIIQVPLELAKATGATILLGPKTSTDLPVQVAGEAATFQLGGLSITAVPTPGHTIDATCWLLKNEAGVNHAIFTGKNLFLGDIGRPGLNSGNMDSIELAAMLFDSIQEKILPLGDNVIVYPAQDQNSSIGKNPGIDMISTIGEQKQTNWVLQPISRVAFIQKLNERLDEAPRVSALNKKVKKAGLESLDAVIKKGTTPVTINVFKERIKTEEVVVLDTRPFRIFSQGYLPGSINIGLDGRFNEWAASLIPFEAPMLLVCEPGKEEESITSLARVGFYNLEGYLAGGFDAWQKAAQPIDLIIDIEADELAMDLPHDDKLVVVDVRNESEFACGHIEDAINLPLNDMADPGNIAMLPEDGNIYLHCSNGYRSTIASSLLKRQGVHNIRNIPCGWNGLKDQNGIKVAKETSILN